MSRARRSPSPRADESIEILVIGDWVVDENWVLAKHRSSFSTMEGKAHMRALGNVNSQVMTFCGAGRVARFLYWVNRFQEPTSPGAEIWISPAARKGFPSFSIFGIGTWAEEDEPKLYKMFHPRYLNGINPFTLRRIKPQHIPHQQLDGLYLQNLARAYVATAKDSDLDEVGTTRIYRLYNLQAETPDGLVLDRRVDFELRYQLSPKERGARRYDDAKLQELLREIPASDPAGLAFAAWQKHLIRDVEALELRLFHERDPGKVPQVRASLAKVVQDLLEKNEPPTASHAGRRTPFRYIVVKDLGKGTMTSALLEALRKEGMIDAHTRWFISSKKFHPSYLDTLAKQPKYGRLRLLLLPPMAIAQMEREGIFPREDGREQPIYKWFVSDQQPTAESLERLEDFLEANGVVDSVDHRGVEKVPLLVVAMPKGLSLLAVEGRGGKRSGFYQPKTILDEVSEELSGRASMFFAALVSQIIIEEAGRTAEEGGATRMDCEEMLEVALKASSDIVHGNIRALKTFGAEPRRGKHDPEFPYDTSFDSYRRRPRAETTQPRKDFDIRVKPLDWSLERDLWEKSRNPTGIIAKGKNSGQYSLELWRAMDELDGYIEVVEPRRREIARLLSALKDYLHQPTPSSFSAMLIAQPGSGKSLLVSKLAEVLGLRPLSFNITQLVSRQNINAWFDAIASAQAQERNRIHMVFFDEINAMVESLNVYDLFLTVLENGTYLRGGHLFKLDPCVWLFAGTSELRSTASTSGELIDLLKAKEPDFKSRLNLDAVRLGRSDNEDAERRSMVYQGALQLQLQHPDVKKISAHVLKAFFCLNEDTSNRKIRQLAGAFRNIRYGEVRAENLPVELREVQRRADHDAIWWKVLFEDNPSTEDLDNILVDIERQPDSTRY